MRRYHVAEHADGSTLPEDAADVKTLSFEAFKHQFRFSPDGLSEAEAGRRLLQYGYNQLTERKVNPLIRFLGYFWGPIPWMIELAMTFSALVRHWPDFYIILVLLVANAVVGFWEEYQAGNAIDALKEKLALRARVRRDGTWRIVPARELVPGDLIRLHLGDIVPADARLLEGDPVEVDQSALTGESLPVTRSTGDTVYAGSILRQGENDALVYGTGRNTYFGKTAQLVQDVRTSSHFQRAVLKIGNFLIVIAVVLVLLILAVALFRGDKMAVSLQFALVLTVAAIPVALPTVLSVTMAVGARILARKEAIVSRLAAIEELAGIDVLCSDKTGTLTQNKLTLGEPFVAAGVDREGLLTAASLASRAENQDPIDLAVLKGLRDQSRLTMFSIVRFQPFDPVRKRSEASVRDRTGKMFRVTKGAAQVILALVNDSREIRDSAEKAVNGFAVRGFRSLAVARTDEGGTWRLLGVLPLFDPPRADSKSTIEAARRMGVSVKMVTGDQLAIGREIAGQLGLGTDILDAAVCEDVQYHETGRMAEKIEKASGFAQVFPEHKYHIVDVLQQNNHIVGMTGDGVNDAPALKKADVGIAVSGATDAARAAAAIVLLTPGLSVIIEAIRESRKIFQRMTSYAVYRISETIRVLLFMTLSILVFNFYPVTAIMIVLLALLNDGAILAIAFDHTRFSNEPERWNMREVLEIASVLGLAGVFGSFGLFYLAERVFHLSREFIQPLMYLKLSVAGHLTIFLTRTRGPFWSTRPARILLVAVIGTQLVATLIAVYGLFMPPIGWAWAGGVWAYALLLFLINDRIKIAFYKILDQDPAIVQSR